MARADLNMTAGEGIDLTRSGTSVIVAAEDATTSNKGIASFSSAYFTVSSGVVTPTIAGIQALLSNDFHNIGGTDADTTYTASGSLLGLSGTTFYINEGTMTDSRLCTYSAVTGLECDTNPSSIASGTVGIGTANRFALYVGVSTVGPSSMVEVSGNVGINTTAPSQRLQVQGTAQASTLTDGTATITGGAITASTVTTTGNVGIGTTSAANALGVASTLAVGATYVNSAAPANGLIVEGNIGIGTTAPQNNFDVLGKASIGSDGTVTAPTNGLYVGGNVGVGSTVPQSALDVNGTTTTVGLSVTGAGAGSLKISSVPTGGGDYFIVHTDGNTGIGSVAPRGKLQVVGGDVKVGTGTFNNTSAGNDLYVTGNLEVDGTLYGDAAGLSNLPAAAGWTDGGTNVQLTAITDNVGIGTTFPSGQVEVVKVGAVAPLMVSSVASGDGDWVIVNSVGNVGIGSVTPTNKLTVNGTLNVISSGNSNFTTLVGLGTVNPQGTLAVVKSGNNPALLVSSVSSATGDYLRIDSAGNVGIGSVTPLNALQVGGNIWSTGYKASGNVGISTTAPSNGCKCAQYTGGICTTVGVCD